MKKEYLTSEISKREPEILNREQSTKTSEFPPPKWKDINIILD